jgi:hypothetical protein
VNGKSVPGGGDAYDVRNNELCADDSFVSCASCNDSHSRPAFESYPWSTASYRPPVPLSKRRACFGGRDLGGAERSETGCAHTTRRARAC